MMKKPTSKPKSDRPFSKINSLLEKFSSARNLKSSKTFYLILIIAGLLLLAIYKKNWFVAATVNGSPITNLELQSRLNQQFRTQTLNQLIDEKIILGEAAKKNVVVTETDIDKKISEIEAQVGGAQALDSLLAQQGQDRNSIKQLIKLRLIVEKLYTNEATVSAEEVNSFIEQNKNQLRATDSAGQEKEAYDAIKSQKLSQISAQKFQELKQKAKTQLF
ncbi:MAG: SurA N-terminal domain-containing protein [Patescibacteria group bacterium]|nr:SurA N-terminal domain-containing protein [Patescibacteria group bacterium]